jgi:enoyl-CoA hydratase/3-hydroxyacyl-CoA dehydrogenase
MAYQFKNITINKLTVIGAGNIGPDICLHFAKVFHNNNVELVLVDISDAALASAKTRLDKKIDRGEKTAAFSQNMAKAMKDSIRYTNDYNEIKGSEIVMEAATEDELIKDKIFKQVEALCNQDTLLLSNSSHMEPEVIYKNIGDQSRCFVTHYFFPAERNPIVEIVPGEKTSAERTETLLDFYEQIGKIPIKVKSSFGFAVDPIFEGLCQTALYCLEQGLGTVKEIDAVAVKTLGLGVGPFTALNLTGGNPITDHGLDEMHDKLISWFRSPEVLKKALRDGSNWETAERGEKVEVPQEKEEWISQQFLGAYFALCSYILDKGICEINDLNMACEIALVVNAPFSFMNEMGIDNARAVVQEFCESHNGFPFPASLDAAVESGGWPLSNIIRKKIDDVAILVIRRPNVLNALNRAVMQSLRNHLEKIENNPELIGTVITGYGNKAFVSGADIDELAACTTAAEASAIASHFQEVTLFIENLNKPVVCALNGLAFGGGNELALACTARLCRKGLPVLVCQPEVNLGIIPGGGGTQRLPRLIGIEAAAEILRTGRVVSAKEAVESGLVEKAVEGDLIGEAVAYVKDIVNKKVQTIPILREPLVNTDQITELELGHLSRKIDEIITRAIHEGAGLTLEQGLELEARLFGECVETEDMKIGMENFLKNGPKVKAEFIHQ